MPRSRIFTPPSSQRKTFPGVEEGDDVRGGEVGRGLGLGSVSRASQTEPNPPLPISRIRSNRPIRAPGSISTGALCFSSTVLLAHL